MCVSCVEVRLSKSDGGRDVLARATGTKRLRGRADRLRDKRRQLGEVAFGRSSGPDELVHTGFGLERLQVCLYAAVARVDANQYRHV